VIKLGEQRGESKCTLVYGQMNEPPGARARVALTGEVHLCQERETKPMLSLACSHKTLRSKRAVEDLEDTCTYEAVDR